MSGEAPRILVVDDDAIVADSIATYLRGVGNRVETAGSGEAAVETIEAAKYPGPNGTHDPFNVIVVDLTLPGMSGLELIKALHSGHPEIVCVVITGYGTIESTVKAIRQGAVDYLTKPLVDEELKRAVDRAVGQQVLLAEHLSVQQQIDYRYGLDNIIGNDPKMRHIFDVTEAVASSRTTILMAGESGTGKSLIARAIHRNSPRADQAFVEISCGSIPETLLESELFGHVKGAFTGAHADKPGRFLAAHGGTLFLDEINSASPGMQLKLLRVLQERRFEPVGSNESIDVDVRVILASNEPLEGLVASGQFRQDLYYRINVVMVQVPPLRDRLADIPLLASHFLKMKSSEVGKQITGFTEEALGALGQYLFPGNVRELENIVERAVVLTRRTRIGVEDLPPQVLDHASGKRSRPASMPGGEPGPYQPLPLRQALEEPEKQIILAALQANEWNRQKTADQLEINRTTLYKKIKQYGLDAEYGEAG